MALPLYRLKKEYERERSNLIGESIAIAVLSLINISTVG